MNLISTRWSCTCLLEVILMRRGDPELEQFFRRWGKLDGCSDGPAPWILVVPYARVRVTQFTSFADQLAPFHADLAVGQCLLQRQEPPRRVGYPVEENTRIRWHGRGLEVYKDFLVVQVEGPSMMMMLCKRNKNKKVMCEKHLDSHLGLL